MGDPAPPPAPKSALMEIQFDEYGGGRAERCTRSSSPTRWSARARRRPTAPTSTAARRHAGDYEPGLPLRSAPAPARRARRAPRRVRDDLVEPNRRYGTRCAGSGSGADAPVLRRARRGRRGPREHRGLRPRAGVCRETNPSSPATSSSGPGRCCRSRSASPATCWIRGAGGRRCSRRPAPVRPEAGPVGAVDAPTSCRSAGNGLREQRADRLPVWPGSRPTRRLIVVDGSAAAVFAATCRERGGACAISCPTPTDACAERQGRRRDHRPPAARTSEW